MPATIRAALRPHAHSATALQPRSTSMCTVSKLPALQTHAASLEAPPHKVAKTVASGSGAVAAARGGSRAGLGGRPTHPHSSALSPTLLRSSMAASAGALARRALGGAPLQQLQLQLQQWNAWHEVACRQLQQHAGQNLRGPRAYSTGVSDGSSSSDGSSASASSASSSSSSSSVVTPPPQRAMPMGYSTSALAGGASEQQEEPQQHEQQQEQQQPLQQQPLEQLRIQLRQEQQHAEAEQVVDAYSLSRSLVGSGPAGAREQAAPAAAAAAAQARLTAADKAALEKLVGILTKDGKKSRARRVLLDAMHIIKQQLAKGRPNGA